MPSAGLSACSCSATLHRLPLQSLTLNSLTNRIMNTLTAQEAALYLGQDMSALEIDPDYTGKIIGIMPNSVNPNLVSVHVLRTDGTSFLMPLKGGFVKLLLRPLSDITEEEATKLVRLFYQYYPNELTIKVFINRPKLGWEYHALDKGKHIAAGKIPMSEPLQFAYLLSRGFDLFGFIDQGKAIANPRNRDSSGNPASDSAADCSE